MSDDIEVKEKKKTGPKPKPKPCEFRNTGSHNIFTEAGRCKPGQIILLTEDQAAVYKGLDKC